MGFCAAGGAADADNAEPTRALAKLRRMIGVFIAREYNSANNRPDHPTPLLC